MSFLESDERISRRDALRWMGKRTLETGYIVGINVVGLGLTAHSLSKDQEKAETSARVNLEQNSDLETKFFAKDIVETARVITDGKDDNKIVELIGGAFAGNAVIAYLLRNHSKLLNKRVGA